MTEMIPGLTRYRIDESYSVKTSSITLGGRVAQIQKEVKEMQSNANFLYVYPQVASIICFSINGLHHFVGFRFRMQDRHAVLPR